MNDPIALLKKDHREAEALLKSLAESKNPGARRTASVQRLVSALTLHMRVEEQFVYPLVKKALGDEPAKEAAIEHKLARTGLTELTKLTDKPGFGAAVAMVTAGIKHHVKEEEQEIFPRLKRHLDRDALANLGDSIASARSPKRGRAQR